ncbi:MAG: hypothetical protein ABR562_08980, partial [Thermoplasmatota archaeon]
SDLLTGLQRLPDAMEQVLARREELAQAAHLYAPTRRHWAVVGNGPNRVAAAEVRIKLSELCYKSIACDTTEDKKHIDLSSEPMILVCAAGLSGSTADDVAKQLAERFHPEDRLMLWFDFFNHDSQRVVRNMEAFMQKVAPRLMQEAAA